MFNGEGPDIVTLKDDNDLMRMYSRMGLDPPQVY